MKKIIRFIIMSLCILSFSSCEDFLDAFPGDKVTDENFWQSAADVDKVLVDIYAATLPKDIFWEECMSDNAYMAWEWWGGQQQFANGTYDTYGEVPANKWSGCYASIRKCWFLLEGLEKITLNIDTPYDVIFTDMQMESDFLPMYAGEWFVKQIKTYKEYKNSRIIIISAAPNIKKIAEKYNVEYLPKPMCQLRENYIKLFK